MCGRPSIWCAIAPARGACQTENVLTLPPPRSTQAMDAALDDASLNLMTPLGPAREDGSIFISIASYRDFTCKDTLKRAFERAARPERVSAGIVQQNCMRAKGCMTGTGWADTRRWVPSKTPDPDCAEAFCTSALGKPHCDAGRVRILRLDEIDSLGPFFTRFVNSKLYRGENFYLRSFSFFFFGGGEAYAATKTQLGNHNRNRRTHRL